MGSHDVIRLGQRKTLSRGYNQNKGVCILSSVVYILGEWIGLPSSSMQWSWKHIQGPTSWDMRHSKWRWHYCCKSTTSAFLKCFEQIWGVCNVFLDSCAGHRSIWYSIWRGSLSLFNPVPSELPVCSPSSEIFDHRGWNSQIQSKPLPKWQSLS